MSCAQRDGDASAYYLDLGDADGRAIKVSARGWSVVDRPDVHFRRPEGLLPLPVPSRDGSIDLLRPYVNLGKGDFRLMEGLSIRFTRNCQERLILITRVDGPIDPASGGAELPVTS